MRFQCPRAISKCRFSLQIYITLYAKIRKYTVQCISITVGDIASVPESRAVTIRASGRRIDGPNYFLRRQAGWGGSQRGLCGKHVLAKRRVFSGFSGCFISLICSSWIVLIIPKSIWIFIKNRRYSKHVS